MDPTRQIIRKILTEQQDYREVVIESGGASAEGYTASTKVENARNWLESEGFAAQASELLSPYEHVGILKNMYVPEELRGQGMGSQILGAWLESAQQDAEAIFLVADLGEQQAGGFDLVKFYEGWDFEVVADAVSGPLMILRPY